MAALACVGIFWLIPAQTQVSPSGVYDLSPSLVPRLSLGLCLLLGLGLALHGWRGRSGRGGPGLARHAATVAEGNSPAGLAFDVTVWVLSSVPVMLLLDHAGFILTGILLLTGWLLFAGVRSIPVVAGIALILPVSLDRLCWYVLTVELP